MGNLFARKKPDTIEETIKKLASGQIDLDTILNPNPVYIVFVSDNSMYQQSGNVMKTKEDHDKWIAGLPKDATVIYFERASNCEPLGTDPEVAMAPRLAANKAKAKARARAIMKLSAQYEAMGDDKTKKARWMRRYSGKYPELVKAKQAAVVSPDEKPGLPTVDREAERLERERINGDPRYVPYDEPDDFNSLIRSMSYGN